MKEREDIPWEDENDDEENEKKHNENEHHVNIKNLRYICCVISKAFKAFVIFGARLLKLSL